VLWLGYKHQREVIRVNILEIHKVKIIIEGPADMVFNAKKFIIYPRQVSIKKKYIEAFKSSQLFSQGVHNNGTQLCNKNL